MRLPRPLPLALLLAACAGKEAPKPAADSTAAAAPAAPSARILVTIGDSTSHVEGIGVREGKLYVNDWKDGAMYRVDPGTGAVERVGTLGTKPGDQLGAIVFDGDGNMYVARFAGEVLRIPGARLGATDFDPKKDVTVFATNVKNANALAFDAHGHLWVTGGDSRTLYHVGPKGGKGVVFAKDYSPISTDTTMPVRIYTVNGIAFDSKGNVYTLNTGTGEVTRLEVKPNYTPGAITTLVKDPSLLGADGALMLPGDTLLVSANFLNAINKVTPDGKVIAVAAHTPALHFPAEIRVVGSTIYAANLNFPVGMNRGSAPGASIAAVPLP